MQRGILANMLLSWSLQTWLLAFAIVLWAAIQYGLVVWTLRDLIHRPRIRGDNKIVWAIVILTVPIIGALLYASIGPTSFLPRPPLTPTPATDGPNHPKPPNTTEPSPSA